MKAILALSILFIIMSCSYKPLHQTGVCVKHKSETAWSVKLKKVMSNNALIEGRRTYILADYNEQTKKLENPDYYDFKYIDDNTIVVECPKLQ